MTPEAEVRDVAIRLLARREHSRKELSYKLTGRGFDDGSVGVVLDALEAERLLSDERFAESFTRSRVDSGHGPLRIRAELRERGVEAAIIEGQLVAAEVDWPALADRVRRRRFGDGVPTAFKERAKQMRYLQYRGFDADQIRAAVRTDD